MAYLNKPSLIAFALKGFVGLCRKFGQDQCGGTIILMALGLTVVLGSAALAIDYARAVTARQMLSAAADAAALAAVSRLPDVDAARQMALDYVEKNLPKAKYGEVLKPDDIEIGTWDPEARMFNGQQDSSGGVAAVRVITRMADSNETGISTLFAWVFGRDSMDVSATAVAGRGGPPCVLALDPTESPALLLDSNAELEMIGCGVQVNSTSPGALRVNSNGSMLTSGICVGGTAELPGSGEVIPEPREYCPGQSDPLATLTPPLIGGCDEHNAKYVDSNATLSPGTYCGGIEIDGESNVTLSAGTYVIQDGPFSVLGNSSVEGSEATIFLTGENGVLFFDSNSSISLTAPTSGEFEGVLFFQDPDFGGTHQWNGNSTTTLRGVIYLPSGKLKSENVNKITPSNSCTVLIANAIEFNSNSGVSIDISSAGCRGALPGPYSRGIVLLN